MRFADAFRRIVFAQVKISAINSVFTGIFLLVLLPIFHDQLPLSKTLVLVNVYLVGLLPVIGNLISNTIIVAVALSVSFPAAVMLLVFLILIHKLEYFLNARIVGGQIEARTWELLVAAICSVTPSTILNRVFSVKSPYFSLPRINIGKCSSVVSHANCAATFFFIVVGALGETGGSGSGTSSSITFHVPGFPSPATVLVQFVGGLFVGMSSKSNRRSAARNCPAKTVTANKKMIRLMPLHLAKETPGHKHFCARLRPSFSCAAHGFQIISATLLPAGMNGSTCSVYGTITSSTYGWSESSIRCIAARRSFLYITRSHGTLKPFAIAM